jgi:hypothetical protein
MQRRDFIFMFGAGAVTCVIGCDPEAHAPGADAAAGASPDTTAAASDGGIDGCLQKVVKMHDTYAQALYLDGTRGPLTGIVTVAHVIAGSMVTMDFWHGHGGQLHKFTLEPAHFEALKRGERVTVGTTTVEGHNHMLFVDPRDEELRVSGAPDVEVPLGC